MEKLLDIDSQGIEHWFRSRDGQHTIVTKQDIQPELEASQVMRNDESFWNKGVKNGLVQYAHIPITVLEKWLKQGVNINDTSELFRMVNTEQWKKLKTTSKNHGSKSSSDKLIILPNKDN